MKRSISLILLLWVAGCASGGTYKRIKPGMGSTDVLIEAGKPADIRADSSGTYWIYTDSNSHPCKVRLDHNQVSKDEVQCDSSTTYRTPASSSPVDEDKEREDRRRRYCGLKPDPRAGCHIDQCINGNWQEICGP